MKEKWITLKQASKMMKVSYLTARTYCKKGILECRQALPKRRSPIYVNLLSIPTFLRNEKKL